jgi:hypothetical protein
MTTDEADGGDPSICSSETISDLESLLLTGRGEILPNYANLTNSIIVLTNNITNTTNVSSSSIPAAIMVPTGIFLYILSLLTFVGNAMVLHAIRTDKRLQTVSTAFQITFLPQTQKLSTFVFRLCYKK